ncbi:MAG: hypothetical protein CML68_23010 [Rhodobacteraceae bacterium]|nr:hypothetical protein [Paracoccaceae bacterium]
MLDRGVIYQAAAIFAHSGHDRSTVDNDIALIKLAQPIEQNGTAATIPLITANSAAPAGPAVIAGRGMMENEPFPVALMETDIRVVSNAVCDQGMAEQTKRELVSRWGRTGVAVMRISMRSTPGSRAIGIGSRTLF